MTYGPPWMATTDSLEVDPGDCRVHTGIPSNSLRCTFSPTVVNRGGLSLAISRNVGVRVSTPNLSVKSVTEVRARNTAVKARDTSDGRPVYVAGSAVALACAFAVRFATPTGGAVPSVIAGSID